MMFLRKKFIYPDMPDSAHSLMNQKGLLFGENSISFSFSPFLLFFCVFVVRYTLRLCWPRHEFLITILLLLEFITIGPINLLQVIIGVSHSLHLKEKYSYINTKNGYSCHNIKQCGHNRCKMQIQTLCM